MVNKRSQFEQHVFIIEQHVFTAEQHVFTTEHYVLTWRLYAQSLPPPTYIVTNYIFIPYNHCGYSGMIIAYF